LASQQPSPPAAPPNPGSVLREHLKREGLDPGQATDEDLAKLFVNGLPQIQNYERMQRELDQASSVAQRYYANAGEFERWMQERDAANQAPPQQQEEKGWKAPEWDPEWENLVKIDEATGRYVPANQWVNPAVVDKVNAFVNHRKQFSTKFFTNPLETLNEAGLERLLEEKLGKFQEKLRTEAYIEQRHREAEHYIQSNYKEFYQTDANGYPIYDSLGNFVLTPRGKAFAYYRSKAEEAGVADPVQQQDFAKKQVRLLELEWERHEAEQMARAAAAEKKAPGRRKNETRNDNPTDAFVYPPPDQAPQSYEIDETPPQDKKQNFLDRARAAKRTTPRDNSIASAAENQVAQNEKLSFKQMALAEARERGELPQTG